MCSCLITQCLLARKERRVDRGLRSGSTTIVTFEETPQILAVDIGPTNAYLRIEDFQSLPACTRRIAQPTVQGGIFQNAFSGWVWTEFENIRHALV
jgi:hypothetical protein